MNKNTQSASLIDWSKELNYSDEDSGKFTRTLVLGESGSGKTHFAGTWPDPFFLDYESGILTLKKMHVPYVTLNQNKSPYDQTINWIRAYQKRAEQADNPLANSKTLVLDSWTELTLRSIYWEMLHHTRLDGRNNPIPKKNPAHNKPEWDDYSAVLAQSRHIAQLTRDINAHFVATCQVQYDTNSEGEVIGAAPSILGSYRRLIEKDFDYIFVTSKEGTPEAPKYRLYTGVRKSLKGKIRGHKDLKLDDPTFAMVQKELAK